MEISLRTPTYVRTYVILFSLLRSGIVGAQGSGGRLGENFLLMIFPEDRGMAARPYVVLYTYVVLRTYS